MAVAFVTVLAAVGTWSSACGSSGGHPTSTAVPAGVAISSISPTSGVPGTEVTIHGSGFAASNNDIAFRNSGIDFQGQHIGYLNDISSSDGSTLTFNLPDNQGRLLGACAFSQLATTEACPTIGLLLPNGESEVFVVNDRGMSNSVPFLFSDPG